MANSTDLAYEQEMFFLKFLDSECVEERPSVPELSEYDEAIEEYEELLINAINYGDKKEIKQLRSEIQHCKAEKRRIKRMMKNRMEHALT